MQNPRPELEEAENEREHLVDQDVHGHVDPDMEEDSEELEESQTKQSSALVSLLSPVEPVDSVEILTPEWRLPYEQRIAWQTAEDEIWKDAINQKVGLVNNFFYSNCSRRDRTPWKLRVTTATRSTMESISRDSRADSSLLLYAARFTPAVFTVSSFTIRARISIRRHWSRSLIRPLQKLSTT